MEAGARRLAAIMFTDIVGYVALTQRDEAEALRLLEEHRGVVRPLVRRFDGTEVKTLGDGFLLEFPSALDASACAVELQRAFHERRRARSGSQVEIRIGIHVGDVIHRGGDVYGDTVNLASRLQGLAEPGGVLVSGPVHDLVRGRLGVDLVRVGAPALKNVELPVEIYRLVFPWAEEFRSRRTPLVDRETEVAALTAFVEGTARGEGSVLLLVGDPGLGKSRLLEEMAAMARRHGVALYEGRGTDMDGGSPYAPWADLLRSAIERLPPAAVFRVLGPHAPAVAQLVPELAEKVPGPPASPDPSQERLRFLEGIAGFFRDLARERPSILVLEDLAGADPATIQLLQHLARSLAHRPLGVVGAVRGSGLTDNLPLAHLVSRLRREPGFRLLLLDAFDELRTARMIEGVLGDKKGVSEEFLALVHGTTGGNPYFIEEVLRSLLKSGAIFPTGRNWGRRPVAEIAMPATVRDVLRERLDRLDPETRDVLRAAAVLGTEFDFDLLRRLTGLDTGTLLTRLERAMQATLLREERRPAHRTVFLFPDRPVRDALYDELSLVRRRLLHRAAGEAIESSAAPGAPPSPAILAHHFLHADVPDKALRYSESAGAAAAELHAHEAAIAHYRTAVDLLDGREVGGRKCRDLAALGDALFALARYGEAIEGWRAAVSCEHASRDPAGTLRIYRKILEALWAMDEADAFLATYRETRPVVADAPDEAEGILLDAESAGFLAWMGVGRDEARAARDRALEAARRVRVPHAESLALLSSIALMSIREKDRAIAVARECLDRSAGLPVPAGAGSDLYMEASGILSLFEGRWAEVQRREEAGIVLTREARLFEWQAFYEAIAADMAFSQGRVDEGRAHVDEMMRVVERFELDLRTPEFLALSTRQFLDGDLDQAEATLGRGIRYLEGRAPRHKGLIAYYSNLARLHTLGQRPGAALDAAHKALEIVRHHDYPVDEAASVALALDRAVGAAVAAGRSDEARAVVAEARGFSDLARESIIAALVDRAAGRLDLAEGNGAEAAARFSRAAEQFDERTLRLEEAETLRLLSEAAARAGDGAGAKRAADRAHALDRGMGVVAPGEVRAETPAARGPTPALPAA